MATLSELVERAQQTAEDSEPVVLPVLNVQMGEIDPLGIRQINFDLMDEALPGLNNVASRVRPFVAIAWAWRRAAELLEEAGGADSDKVRNFVDRIDVVYAWSQFVVDNPGGLAGRNVLSDLIGDPDAQLVFDDAPTSRWIRRRNARRKSTGITSPLNYGPGLRSLGWLAATNTPGLDAAAPDVQGALDGFEASIAPVLDMTLFTTLEPVTITRDQVAVIGDLWRAGQETVAEQQVALDLLEGPTAQTARRNTTRLIRRVVEDLETQDTHAIRVEMCETDRPWLSDPEFASAAGAWYALQMRQLFRLTLEAMFVWLQRQLENTSLPTSGLVERFLAQIAQFPIDSASPLATSENPAVLWAELERLLYDDASRDWQTAPAAFSAALQLCMQPRTQDSGLREVELRSPERLPLSTAQEQFWGWSDLPEAEMLARVMEQWILGQHSFWSIGRGLADARSGGKILLRLKVVMGEDGWTLTPGANPGSVPAITGDRLATAISLLRQCGAFD